MPLSFSCKAQFRLKLKAPPGRPRCLQEDRPRPGLGAAAVLGQGHAGFVCARLPSCGRLGYSPRRAAWSERCPLRKSIPRPCSLPPARNGAQDTDQEENQALVSPSRSGLPGHLWAAPRPNCRRAVTSPLKNLFIRQDSGRVHYRRLQAPPGLPSPAPASQWDMAGAPCPSVGARPAQSPAPRTAVPSVR